LIGLLILLSSRHYVITTLEVIARVSKTAVRFGASAKLGQRRRGGVARRQFGSILSVNDKAADCAAF
jgi:hypothetical protein